METEVLAPPQWRSIDFISDLHLGSDTPLTFAAWARYLMGSPADAIFILGDLFEVWVGDDARFEGFEASCTEVLAEAARLRPLYFMVGNRDFLVGSEMLAACRVTALSDPCVLRAFGERWLLSHGDELCISDTEYQKFRSMVRDPAWQAHFLAQPLEERQRYARDVRSQSEMRKKSMSAPSDWADVDPRTAVDWLRRADSQVLIHGHTHRPATEALAPGYTRHVLSDWDQDHLPHRAEVLRLTSGGLTRLPLEAALA